MKILLKQDVETLGLAGDIVTVADGYARNYLIPKGLAVKATAGQVKQVDVIRRQAQVARERVDARMAALAERLTGTLLTFEVSASERGRLYGSVTQDDIAEALELSLGESVDRRKLVTNPLRQIGLHSVPVRLSSELIPAVSVVLHREGEDPSSYLPVPDEPVLAAEEAAVVEEEGAAGEAAEVGEPPKLAAEEAAAIEEEGAAGEAAEVGEPPTLAAEEAATVEEEGAAGEAAEVGEPPTLAAEEAAAVEEEAAAGETAVAEEAAVVEEPPAPAAEAEAGADEPPGVATEEDASADEAPVET